MKFSQMEYKRPDLDEIKDKYKKITADFPNCKNANVQYNLILEHEKLSGKFDSMYNIAYIRNSIDTNNEYYDKEIAFFDSNMPVVQEFENDFLSAVSKSKFKDELIKKTGDVFFKNIELKLRSFSPEIIDLMKKENALVTEYEKLLASAKIDFDGEIVNLSEITKYQIASDEKTRKKAWEKTAGFFTENSKRLDDIYDELVKNRTEQAKRLGYENYVGLGYDRLGRNCYDVNDVKKFRAQVVSDLVPLVAKIKERQAKRFGANGIKFWNDACLFPQGNPKPKGDRSKLVNEASRMYHEMSPITGEFFDFMTENELFDLDSKKGKMGGGYCTEIINYKSPFIFANFNGTAGDVEVLTHEAGHAFAYYMVRNMELGENHNPSMETAETHSMSMELFSRPWDNLFFKEDADRFHEYQLEAAVDFIPYGSLVDDFQTTIYENPELTPDERKAVWLKLEKKYRPWIDFDSLPFFKDGGGYQRQHHIYSFPLYYIDYCIAQTTALEFFAASKKDRKNAFERYLTFVKAGGTKTYKDVMKLVNLELPFNEGCIKRLTKELNF